MFHPFTLVTAAFTGFVLGFVSGPAWFAVGAAFAAAWLFQLARWLFSR